MMKYQFIVFSLLSSILLSAPLMALPKHPENLGTIMDPEEAAQAKFAGTPVPKEAPLFDDQEFPELPQTLRWEISLTSKAIQVSDTLRTRSDLITALSKGVEYLCLGELQRTLSYTPPPQEKNCLKILSLLNEIDPVNPIAICVNTGIGSEDCRKAYAEQGVESKIPPAILSFYKTKDGKTDSKISFQDDLTVKLEAEKVSTTQQQIRSELSQLANSRVSTKDASARKLKEQALLHKYLQVSCGQYRIVVFPPQIAAKVPTPRGKSNTPHGNQSDSLKILLEKGPFNNSAKDSAEKALRTRFRLVSANCLEAIKFAEAKDASLTSIPCRRDGLTAPSCIMARRKAVANPGSPQTNVFQSEGIERF